MIISGRWIVTQSKDLCRNRAQARFSTSSIDIDAATPSYARKWGIRAMLTGLAIVFLMYSPRSFARQRPKLCGDLIRIQKVLQDIRVMAAELKGMASAQKDYITRKELTKKAKNLTKLVEELRHELALKKGPGHKRPEITTQAPVLTPISPNDFQQLLNAIDAEGFPKGKLRVLKNASPHNNFTVEQIKQVMKKFSFSSGKTQAAAMLYSRLLDKFNFYKVYDELPFDSDKEKLKQMVTK